MKSVNELIIAVLIDAENVTYSNIKGIMEEIAKHGIPTFKRIYGDWTKPNLGGWKSVLLENAITPIQQYSYTTGKNSTDSAMIIDAMDILYSGKVDGFCIVSSDSDFTRLAIRLREAGMKVIGIGEKKTPASLIAACDKFTYIEIIKSSYVSNTIVDNASSKNKITDKKQKDDASRPEKISHSILDLISTSISDLADEEGWVYLGDLGNLIIKKQPDFDPRNFGFSKLTPLIKSLEIFEIDERNSGQPNVKHNYIRNRKY